MKFTSILFLSIVALAVPGTSRAADVTFPDTPIGRHVRAYFAAFPKGEAAMRAYFEAHGDADALKQRPAEARLALYRNIKADLETLTPVRVLGSDGESMSVEARDGHGGPLQLTFHFAPKPPHGLLGIQFEHLGDDETGPGAPPPPMGPPQTEAQIVAALSAEVDSLAKAGAFSGVVLLDKGGKTIFSRAAGMADREKKKPNTMETRFNIGSINKAFTATAIRQLAQKGKLGLDDPIAKHLTDFPSAAAKKITIRMLLDHRSGIADILESPGLFEHRESVRSTADWYRLIKDQPLRFEPGTKQEYSNGGYAVLGMIAERVSGQDYYAYIREHIYGPAGMTKSDSYSKDEIPADAAIGYTRHPDGMGGHDRDPKQEGALTAIPWHFGKPSSAGGGWSTAGDLLRFRQAMVSGKLLPADAGSELQGPGMGIAGGSPGCNALLNAEGPYTLIVLSNFDPPSAERFMRSAGRALRRAAGGPGPEPEGGRKVIRAGGGAH